MYKRVNNNKTFDELKTTQMLEAGSTAAGRKQIE